MLYVSSCGYFLTMRAILGTVVFKRTASHDSFGSSVSLRLEPKICRSIRVEEANEGKGGGGGGGGFAYCGSYDVR